MSKVGIMSMQRIANYGSFLQAYALKSILEEMGHEVQFVDYHVGEALIEDKEESGSGLSRKIKKVKEVLSYRASLVQKIKFIFYKKNFSKKCYPELGISEKMNYNPELDVLIIGSDEVFNCVQKNSNVGYSLELFGKDNKARSLVSYAASFGNTTIEKLEQFRKKEEIARFLKAFEFISVRDENSGYIVEKLTGRTPLYHLDPVLVYDYLNKCDKIPRLEIEERYMILYAYSGRISEEESRMIKEYAKGKKLKIYAIGGIQSYADKFIDCSPFEVLAYFRNAECVVTDTFHGTIFSVITERPFITLIRKSVGNSYGNEEKIVDLLRRLKLEDRIVKGDIDFSQMNLHTDSYNETRKIIEETRKETISYLISICG